MVYRRLVRDGRAQTLLRAAGLAVWVVVGAPSWSRLLDAPEDVGGGRPAVWVVCYALFAVCFAAASRERLATRPRLALLAAQSALAVALAALGMPHFEGALFAVVAAEAALLLAPSPSLAWAAAQGLALFPLVWPSHGTLGALKATLEYAAFAAFANLVFALFRRERAARVELAAANAELVATRALLAESARKAERLRLAREVHDAIGHGLTAASVHLQLASRLEDPKEPLKEAQAAVKATLEEVRALVRAERDEGPLDLAAAVRGLGGALKSPRVHVDAPATVRVKDPERAHALYRSAQEALTNAVRHARAENVWIELSETSVRVRDDGRGADALILGSGLRGLRERVEALGGALAIDARPGEGVRIDVRFEEASS